MSVIVKGMKMPNNCMACDLEEVDDCGHDYRCPLIYKGYTSKIRQDGRLPKCPLGELPEKHGRLVDVDELSKAMYHDAFESDTDLQKWDSGCWIRYKLFEKNRDNAPTVIEAEGETPYRTRYEVGEEHPVAYEIEAEGE